MDVNEKQTADFSGSQTLSPQIPDKLKTSGTSLNPAQALGLAFQEYSPNTRRAYSRAFQQLQQWAERAGCDFVSKEAGSDPSSVMYETISKAVSEDYDVVICDTAGRLHTKKNLMEELKKMVRVIRKQILEAPHQILLVLDASTGQNAIFQTREFLEATELTGLVITKLDGTSKGGVIIGIVNEFDVPVRYIGIGEQIRDLRPFDPKAFADSLFV